MLVRAGVGAIADGAGKKESSSRKALQHPPKNGPILAKSEFAYIPSYWYRP